MARSKSINTILNLKDNFSSKFKKTANLTKDQSRQMKKLDHHMGRFKKSASNSFTSVAKKAGVAAAAFVGAAAAASKIGEGIQFVKDYQSSLSNLQAATGATAAETATMKEQITDLYKQNMGESWNDLATAMTTAKQVTGQVGEELKQTTAMAVTYRDVFGEDVTQSVKAADTMMKNFGITSEQSFNLLSQGAQKGLNKSDELLDTANEYSVYYKTLGYSANEMFDQFAAGLETGAFNLDKVGDAVKEFGIRIKDDSKLTNEALAQLFAPDDIVEWTDALTRGGVKSSEYMELTKKVGAETATQMVKNLQKGGKSANDTFTTLQAIMGDGQNILDDLASGAIQGKDAMQMVIDKLSNIKDPIEKSTIGVALFGTQFEDMEADVIAALGSARNQFDMTKGTMDEINKIKYNDAKQAFEGIGRLVETSVLIPIADRVLPKLSEFGEWFKNQGPAIESAIDKAFTQGAKVLDGFGKAISWAKDNAGWLVPVVVGLTSAIAAQKVIGTISKLYKAWTAATKVMTVAQIALNIATKASPFGWVATIIGLVVAAGVALWQNWDVVKEKAVALWDGIKNAWSGIKDWVSNIFGGIKDYVSDSFNNMKETVMDKVKGVEDWLNSFPLGQSIVKGFKESVENAKKIFGGITQFFKSVFKGDWKGAWDGLTQISDATIGKLKDKVKAPIDAIAGFFKSIPEKAGEAFDNLKESVMNKVQVIEDWLNSFPLGQSIVKGFKESVENAKNIFGGITKFIKSVFKGDWKGAWSGITQIFDATLGKLKDKAKAPIDAVIGFFKSIPTKAGEAIDKLKSSITEKITNIKNWLSSFPFGQGLLSSVEDMYKSMKDIFGNIVTFVKSVFKGDWKSAWDSIVQAFSSTFSMIKTYAKAPLNGVIDLVNIVIDKINGFSVPLPKGAEKIIGTDKIGFDIPRIPNFGLGTPYFTGGLARINERNGGEIVNLPNGSQVIPSDKSQQLIDNSKGETKIEIHIHGNVIGDEENINRIFTAAVAKLKLAQGNM